MSAVTEERCSYKRRGTVPLMQEPPGPRSLLIMLPLLLLLSLLLASAVPPRHAAPVLKGHGDSDTKCPLTVKILDAVKGTAAGPMALTLYKKTADGGWTQIATGMTNETGEIHDLITEEAFPPGVYRVDFDTKSYWKKEGSTPFHEVTNVVFEAHSEVHRHYTLAMLLSPHSFTSAALVTDVRH